MAQAPVESVLTCMGLDEFVRYWTELRLGEVWHAGAVPESDRVLRNAVQAAVGHVRRATRKLAKTADLFVQAAGETNLSVNGDNPGPDGRGLGIVSTIIRLAAVQG